MEEEVRCPHCQGDELILVQEVVGSIVIDRREDGSYVGDGGPEFYDATESASGQMVWCVGCGRTVEPS